MKTVLDVLARLRNGAQTKKKMITLPYTMFTKQILIHLKRHNLIKGYDWNLKTNSYCVYFRHWTGNVSWLENLKLVTKPSNRNYITFPKMVNYYGKKAHVLISTSHGIFNHRILIKNKAVNRIRMSGEALAIIKH
jgi:ribosomal protein S8